MLFNSAVFLIFIGLFFGLWPIFRKQNKTRWAYITFASFVFYGWWDWRFLFLLIGSGLLDYFSGLCMEKFPGKRKFFLYASLTGNLGSLFIFKYSGFLAQSIDLLFSNFSINLQLYEHIPSFTLILPVGISFYTFQSVNYVIDVYRGELKPARNIFHFFAYLSLFPHLVAGPILRARQMIPQMETLHIPVEGERWRGMKLIAQGFFMKMVIADRLAPMVNEAFNNPIHIHNMLYWWVSVSFFAFQIYYDFAGYSNIAIGLLCWMGYYVPPNFNHPYRAASLKEFWQRWHISLSTWFRDYVYFPLGGSRKGILRADYNMAVAMILSGLWHGASWTFVIWGVCHAVFLIIERRTLWPGKLIKITGSTLPSKILTIIQVWLAWVFFRSAGMQQAWLIIKSLFSFSLSGGSFLNAKVILLLSLALIPELPWREWAGSIRMLNKKTRLAGIIFICALLVISVYFRGPGTQFIYFQF
jgi:alginate O-acetyltransferase complex protein AlgI